MAISSAKSFSRCERAVHPLQIHLNDEHKPDSWVSELLLTNIESESLVFMPFQAWSVLGKETPAQAFQEDASKSYKV